MSLVVTEGTGFTVTGNLVGANVLATNETRLSAVENKAIFNQVNVKDYGAVGDGVTDDTSALNTVLALGGFITFPSGTYMIDAETNLDLVSDTTIYLEKGAKLKAITNSATSYAILQATNISNFVIMGEGEIEGESDTHTGSTGEWGMGIGISGCNNFLIKDIKVSNCWGDGIYIYGNSTNNQSTNGIIKDVYSTGNRRNNLSIIAGKDIQIIRGRYTLADGTSPEAGIDVEPNPSDGYKCENILIDGAEVFDNSGCGIVASQSLIEDLSIKNCIVHDNALDGILCEVAGKLNIQGNKSYSNTRSGIRTSGNIAQNRANIFNNYCYNNGWTGIEGRFLVDSKINENVSYLNQYEGIKLHSTDNDYNIIDGNIVHSNSQAGNSSYANIYITAGSNYNRLSNNITRKGSETNKPSYGISDASGTAYITDNHVTDGGNTRGIGYVAGTIVKNNTGLVTENSGSGTTSSGTVTVTHGLWKAPTSIQVIGTIAGEIVAVTTVNSSNFVVTVKQADGSTAGTNQTVYWKAEAS